jgi:ATP-dependent DNA helicase HFM1/MER3
MELAMLRLLSKRISPGGIYDPPAGAVKVVYIAPMRALVQEKVKSWQDRSGSMVDDADGD